MSERGISYEGNPPVTSDNQRRVALVIGNGSYAHASPLENPANDAAAMAGTLARLGFDVVKGIDLDLRAMGDVQEKFEARLRGKPDVALLFYAGHGLQVKGRNYLVPIDAQIEAQAHLASRAILFNDILEPMAEDAGASLIFLDACRDNPFTRNLARTMGDAARSSGVRGGLARIEKVAGTFISYATAPDTVAYDGKGNNSPFTGGLLRHIETPGLSVSDMMIDVRNAVLRETNNRQEPWDQSSLRKRFYFVPEETELPNPMEPSSTMSAAAEEWAAIKDTSSLAALALFKKRHPDTHWVEYADIRAGELREADKKRKDEAKFETERSKAVEAATEEPPARVEAQTQPVTAPHEKPSTPQVNIPGDQSTPLPWGLIGAGGLAMVAAAALVIWQPWKPQPGTTFRDCANCPEMVVVPAGSFLMGSPKSEANHESDEEGPGGKPLPVKIGTPFAVGKFEITNAQYVAFLNSIKRRGPKEKPWFETKAEDSKSQIIGSTGRFKVEPGKENYPVVNVSWYGATAYANWLSRETSKTYRLPSEAEWEYAARGVTNTSAKHTAYWWGNNFDASKANNGSETVSVGRYDANRFGLYDMHGNVWEWVEDCYMNSYKNAPNDGSANTSGNCVFRGLRGGSWNFDPRSLRSASRYVDRPVVRNYFLGFRVARTL